ncbi:MAG: bifunctional metallophosphatase/5'-nucleotidase [Actinomycetota bacterium]
MIRRTSQRAIGVGIAAALLLATIGITSFAAAPAAEAQDDTVTLTLLHNNDGESKLLPDRDAGFPGIARFTQMFQELGTSTTADILLRVTAGDNFLASPAFSAGLEREGEPLYDSVALSGLYEAMALGNHDFDFGPDVTARFIEGFNPAVPFLAANLDVSGEPALQALADAGRIAKSMVFADPASGEEIGIIGAITPRLGNISSPRNAMVDPDIAGAVNAEVATLTSQGVNRIVLVSHLQGLSEDRELVPQLRGVDIVVAGGGDELLKNDGDTCLPDEAAEGAYPLVLEDLDGNAVPVVTAPGGYRCIGRLEVTFDGAGDVIEWEGTSVGVRLGGDVEDFARDNVERPLFNALSDLEATVLGSSDVVLDGRRSSVRTGPTNVGELLASALLAAGQSGPDFGGAAADVAIQNGGGIRNDAEIPAGEITAADTFNIAPFSNFAVTVEVPRERFKELLEVALAGLPEAAGTYPQIAGFTLAVDPAQPARQIATDGDCSLTGDPGARVQDVTLDDGTAIVQDGQVVDGPPIVLATIDFLARGGDCYPLGDLQATRVGVSYQQALADYISGDLGGSVRGEDFPAGGANTSFGDDVDGGSDPAGTEGDEPAETEAPTVEESEETAPAEETSEDEALPTTGQDSWLYLIVALTVAAGGAMVWSEARRTSRRSLRTRLATTRPADPEDFVRH